VLEEARIQFDCGGPLVNLFAMAILPRCSGTSVFAEQGAYLTGCCGFSQAERFRQTFLRTYEATEIALYECSEVPLRSESTPQILSREVKGVFRLDTISCAELRSPRPRG
jgi:hypothetical protein